MRLMRFGPSIVFLRGDVETLKKGVAKLFGVEEIPTEEAIRESSEFETILLVTPPEETKTIPPETGFLVKRGAKVVLAEIVNSDLPVKRVEIESTIILLRIPEKVEEALKMLAEKFGGEVMTQLDALNLGEACDTVISVTRKKLSSPIGPEDVEGAVLVRRDFLSVYRELLIDLPMLLFKLLPEWNEVTIKLYDTNRRYEENIERLLLVIEDLDLGFIVGEGWDWDYPRPFMRVPVYRLKLLTWEKPERVKFLLKGLEYRGYTRLCDIDVFVGKKKIDWVELGKFKSKFELAEKAREELEKLLSEDVRKKLHEIEERLLGETGGKAEKAKAS
ncbi:hypothetical protein [Thermococcus sp.]|uniref:hypothetical protein n=1 Tax=Thermococcus sp. TaxID=35749 RepID=UPI00261F2DE0|nr:hypothetical protein [Thermococcus sp.]